MKTRKNIPEIRETSGRSSLIDHSHSQVHTEVQEGRTDERTNQMTRRKSGFNTEQRVTYTNVLIAGSMISCFE